MNMKNLILLLSLLFPLSLMAGSKDEVVYYYHYAATHGMKSENVEPRHIPDLMTEVYVIEVDFACKCLEKGEGIEQARRYAKIYNRLPGVILIIEDDKDLLPFEVKSLDELKEKLISLYGMVFVDFIDARYGKLNHLPKKLADIKTTAKSTSGKKRQRLDALKALSCHVVSKK